MSLENGEPTSSALGAAGRWRVLLLAVIGTVFLGGFRDIRR